MVKSCTAFTSGLDLSSALPTAFLHVANLVGAEEARSLQGRRRGTVPRQSLLKQLKSIAAFDIPRTARIVKRLPTRHVDNRSYFYIYNANTAGSSRASKICT